MFNKVNILGVTFDDVTQEEAVDFSLKRLKGNDKTFIVTANPEIVMYAKDNLEYKNTVDKADLVVADGIGVVIGSKILKNPLKERVAGFDLMKRLLNESSERGLRVFLIGAKETTLNKTVKNIKKAYPGIHIVGTHDGYFSIDDVSVTQQVVDSKPDIIFAAMGFPRQEQWIQNYFSHMDHGLAMGVGGSFDVWADEVKRAPLWIQRINLEWFYRLLKNPKRIGRMLVLPKFIVEVFKEKRRIGAS